MACMGVTFQIIYALQQNLIQHANSREHAVVCHVSIDRPIGRNCELQCAVQGHVCHGQSFPVA